MTGPAENLRSQAEHLSGPLPPLLLAAQRLAASLALGFHGRRRPGRGEAFWQYRPYQWGDPSRSIDWRQSARSDDIFVRETEWSVAASLWFWVDNVPSMNWRSSKDLPTKAERAALLTLSLALLASKAGEQVTLAGMGNAPSAHESNIVRMARTLTAPDRVEGQIQHIPEHAEVVLFSDFEVPPEEIETLLAQLTERKVRATLVQISDPAEERFPYQGHVTFTAPDGHLSAKVKDSAALRPAYRKFRKAHKTAIGEMAARRGWLLHNHRTDHPASTALLALHAGLTAPPG